MKLHFRALICANVVDYMFNGALEPRKKGLDPYIKMHAQLRTDVSLIT